MKMQSRIVDDIKHTPKTSPSKYKPPPKDGEWSKPDWAERHQVHVDEMKEFHKNVKSVIDNYTEIEDSLQGVIDGTMERINSR